MTAWDEMQIKELVRLAIKATGGAWDSGFMTPKMREAVIDSKCMDVLTRQMASQSMTSVEIADLRRSMMIRAGLWSPNG